MEPTVPTAAAPKPPGEAPPAPALDLAQIKSMLNLPETASDIELITALVELISNLQQKYDALLADAVSLEDKVANRDLQDFADVILPTDSAKEFWKGQLLTNRDQAVQILEGLRTVKQAAATPAPAPAAPREPLRNRLADHPKTVAELAGEPALADAGRAVAIRNRAHELRKTDKLPWGEAFARAEKEMTK